MRCYRHIRMNYLYTNRFCVTFYIKVPKSKPCKLRLNFPPSAIGYHNKTLGMLMGKVKFIIWQYFFRKSHCDGFTFFRVDFYYRHTGCILSAIVAITNFFNRKCLNISIRRTIGHTIFRLQPFCNDGIFPITVIEIIRKGSFSLCGTSLFKSDKSTCRYRAWSNFTLLIGYKRLRLSPTRYINTINCFRLSKGP